jgi:hypothetical protein
MAGPVIIRLMAMGIPASKIIAKYGKKVYNASKKQWKAFKKSEKEEWKNRVTLKDIKDYHGGGWKLARNLASIPIGATLAGLGLNELKKRGYIKPSRDTKSSKDKNTMRSSKDKKFQGHTGYR